MEMTLSAVLAEAAAKPLEIWTTFAASVSALAALAGLGGVVFQMKAQRLESRKWATVKACRAIEENSNLVTAIDSLFEASEKGTHYSNDLLKSHLSEIITVLNYLDGVAIGICQGIYVEAIAKDNLGPMVKKAVEVYLLDKAQGSEPYDWKCEDAYPPYSETQQADFFPNLLHVYHKWNPKDDGPRVNHQE